MLEEQDADCDTSELESHLDELAMEDLNGRQIRNCLLTAQQFASYHGERLSWEHLSLSIKTATDFQRYLNKVNGHSDEQWAREERLR